MRATVPFLAAGMAVAAAAACGGPSSGSAADEKQVTGKGGSSGADSGAAGDDGGSLGGTFGAGGSSTLGGSGNGDGGGSTGAGGSPGGGASGSSSSGGSNPTGACNAIFKDCNGDTTDGCETDTSSDAQNCGACGTACAGAAHAAPSCFVGKCDIACASGFGDCNNDASDGCEQDLTSDPNNCGACGMVCDNTECVDRACKCASTATTAAKVPLDMYILFDQSGSMKDSVTGGTKWDVIKNALTTFVQSPGSAGMRVGIGYFPLTTSSSSGTGGSGGFCIPFLTCSGGGNTSCNWMDYAVPDVGIDLLPGVSTAIVTSLGNHGPGGDTPTYPALQGAYSYATIWATANPDRKTIVVLATDGDPTNCGSTNNVTDISNQLVAPALAQNPSLLTFVIGVGKSLGSLNQIAAAGGTGQAFIIDTAGADPGGQFLKAMQNIQGSAALGCEYGIPSPPSGTTDFNKVNVQFTPPNGTPTLLKKVPDAASCTGATGGWHYDDNASPTRIILCDSSCSAIQSFSGATVEVQLGCASVG